MNILANLALMKAGEGAGHMRVALYLRGHVLDSAHRGDSQLLVCAHCQAKVTQHDLSCLGQEDVLQLEVPASVRGR